DRYGGGFPHELVDIDRRLETAQDACTEWLECVGAGLSGQESDDSRRQHLSALSFALCRQPRGLDDWTAIPIARLLVGDRVAGTQTNPDERVTRLPAAHTLSCLLNRSGARDRVVGTREDGHHPVTDTLDDRAAVRLNRGLRCVAVRALELVG